MLHVVDRSRQNCILAGSHRPGPRVIRTLRDLWGILSVSIRELLQLHDGHVPLGFSILAMAILSANNGIGILEHPGEPNDPDAASIWRLPIIKMLLNLPGFELLTCAPGLLGADRAKRTGLLTLNMPSLPRHIHCNLLRSELPHARSIGLDATGCFRTAKLKEYPPALCKAFAECFLSSFPPSTENLDSLPTEFLTICQKLHCTEMGHTIGADCAVKG